MRLFKTSKKVSSLTLTLVSAFFVALLAACGTAPVTTTTTTSSSASSAAPTTTSPQLPQLTVTTLKHSPSGTADLSWDPESHKLTVKIALTGVAPSSSHAAHIHAGSCSAGGGIVYPLNQVVADAKGVATSETTISNVQNGIPATGWYINVHNGLTMAAIDDRPISCGNIANSNTSKDSMQSVHVTMGATTATNENASGQAQLALLNGRLAIKITLSGLEADSTHAAHIHAGSCEAQGPVVVMLNPVVADAQGNGTSITYIKSLPTSPDGLYVNVHTGASMSQLGQAVFFNPIACGNLPLS